MRAILIDPIARTFTEVEHNGDYRQIYELLSDKDNGLEVDDFNIVYIDAYNTIFVDGEGLLKKPRYFFHWRGYKQPLAGRGLILGAHGPESASTKLTIDWVRERVIFQELSMKGFILEEGPGKHPMFGDEEINIIKQTPVFGPPENDNGD